MLSIKHFFTFALSTSAIALGTAEIAFAAKGHSHGKANFDIALDANTVRIVSEIPLESVVGFERVPRNEADTAKVKAAAVLLRNADRLFTFSEGANCKSKQTELTSSALDGALLGGTPKAAAAAPASDAHIDVDAVWVFQCDKPEALKSITINAFDDFKSLKVIQVKVVGGKRQAGARLTASSRKVSW